MRHRSRTHLIGISLAAVLVLPLAAGCGGDGAGPGLDPERNADATDVTLRIAANAVAGGKNATGAQWINEYVIPGFTAKMKAKGVNVKVTFEGAGVEDEQYKTKRALDLKTRSGADLMNLDGIWTGEFAQAGYLLPLEQVVGDKANSWDGWSQIPGPIQSNASFGGKRYGLPWGTDGRVVFYNKELFTKAGLPATWQPRSWEDILVAGRALKKLPGVTPIQLNAGTAMGEATTMQGVLPMLAGTGRDVYAGGKWMGTSPQLAQVLSLYKAIFDEGLGDKETQLQAKGRDKSFADFAEDKVGILFEGDYFWRSVINPDDGIAPMKDRDATVGYALIPAQRPGAGVRGQDFVSYSGGATWMINPNTDYPQQTWELLQFMGSAEAVRKANELTSIGITQRNDVNKQVLSGDPLLKMISEQVLPITSTRPSLAAYTEVSVALQQATADIVSGKSPQQAAQTYKASVERAAGGAANVSTG